MTPLAERACFSQVNTPGKPPVFKYTSHAWLLDLFLDCPRHLGLACPAAESNHEVKFTGLAQNSQVDPKFAS